MSTLTGAYRGGYEGEPGWYLSAGYDRDQVEALKQAVPHTARSWNPDTKQWWISAQYEDAILRLWPAFAAFQAQTALF